MLGRARSSMILVGATTGKHSRRMLKQAVQQGRSECRTERVPSGVRGGSERCENAAGGLFQRLAGVLLPGQSLCKDTFRSPTDVEDNPPRKEQGLCRQRLILVRLSKW
jgi:hypothetical protein